MKSLATPPRTRSEGSPLRPLRRSSLRSAPRRRVLFPSANALAQLAAHLLRHGVLLTELQTDEFRKAARQETEPQLQIAFAATLGSLQPDLARASGVLKAVPPRGAKK